MLSELQTKKMAFEPVINSMDDYYTYMQDSSGRVFIPSTTWADRISV